MLRLLGLVLLLLGAPAFAQGVQQSGPVTPSHTVCWVTDGVVKDCGVNPSGPYKLTSAPYTLTDSATVTPDFNLAWQFSWTLTGSGHTLANPANLSTAQIGQQLLIYIIQGGAGSYTITWGSAYRFPGGTKPTLSTTVGALDAVTCNIQATTVINCSAGLNFQ